MFIIILIIIGAVLLITYLITFGMTKVSDTVPEKLFNRMFFIGLGSIYFLILGIGSKMDDVGSKRGYIESLKGKNPWEMEIRYEFKDDEYLPVDTIFVKKDIK